MVNRNKSKKILLLYVLIFLAFVVFLSVMLLTATKSRNMPSLYTVESSKAQRGSIISADGFHIATTKKLYKAVVNTRYIDPDKKELFIKLFSIYSGMSPTSIKKRLAKRRGVVVLSYDVPQIQAHYLKTLARELRRFKVFLELKNPKTGLRSVHGLSVLESGESREYPYGTLLTPIIGYPHKIEEDGYTSIRGVKGLEKRFDTELSPIQDGYSRGKRDVNSYIILNKESFTKPKINGLDIKLTIPVSFQIRIEKMLDAMKKELRAKEVMIAIMDSKRGDVYAMASSNRYLPKDIKRSDYSSLNSSMIEYSFEPGSVLKPITFALLLEHKLVNPYDLVNGHNGRFKIGRKVITDEHKFDWLSAENVIVYSSNVGIAQLAQRLPGYDFHRGLKSFGFSTKSTPDLIYEKTGSIPSAKRLENEIYKATCAYGYGIRANLMQLLRAYSAFNNNGRMVKPKLVKSFIDERGSIKELGYEEPVQVIKSATAKRMNKILLKTVNEGTGKKAITKGLQVGGKTGTAHIVEKGQYVSKYNTAFMGFANDKKHKYTIGVIVIQPKKSQFAAQTAVPVFKKAVDIMIEEGYLEPNIVK
ncbi:peptidoglycan D,D-transpeptidase FtsI family protein [Sulfurimonas autotrophica]|uniref:Peptidoglycan glycosyltransferase n=1 Tax=Sulfurimonas autotrophica (strain ATCC BAA-671 / DSM 16294 / JCM 11897 / OK10) TaxID=563040 RepID=E0UUE1_SULAO|nr:penicillin-binding protein 2 [Sulfurimonas autotrophica]ADN08377.1 Peptidoglycan glycosyltransferase [Sulfurimonas autotrophica DSM 16294]